MEFLIDIIIIISFFLSTKTTSTGKTSLSRCRGRSDLVARGHTENGIGGWCRGTRYVQSVSKPSQDIRLHSIGLSRCSRRCFPSGYSTPPHGCIQFERGIYSIWRCPSNLSVYLFSVSSTGSNPLPFPSAGVSQTFFHLSNS